jgi:DNA-3-methyladenine glycosylase I
VDSSLQAGVDGYLRCRWATSAEDYVLYHDQEWGFPVDDDQRLFEKICLEGFQAGLSWITILRKRENFRLAFENFDFEKVARFTKHKVEHLLLEAGIVRHRGKIESTVNNSKRARELVNEYGSLASYFWSFEPEHEVTPKKNSSLPVMTPESKALSKDLKRRGWSFVGPTTCYAFMQAMGLVNDHLSGCLVQEKAALAKERFKPPCFSKQKPHF